MAAPLYNSNTEYLGAENDEYLTYDPTLDGISLQDAVNDLSRVVVPGLPISHAPLQNADITAVTAGGAFVGYVQTFFDPLSNTFVNVTQPGHLFDTGVVGFSVSEQGNETVLAIHGFGQNTDTVLSALNVFAGKNFAFGGVAANLSELINPSSIPLLGSQ